MFKQLLKILGYEKNEEHAEANGYCISTTAQADLDYIFEKTGLRAHKVSPNFRFNGSLLTKDDEEANKIESLLFRYSRDNYVFTNDYGILVGNICTITTKDDRVQIRRSNIKIVNLELPNEAAK